MSAPTTSRPSARPAPRQPGRAGLRATEGARSTTSSSLPGDRFSEAELGHRLGVSRTPVREALFRLRNEGFLDVESKSGWFVRPIDFDRLEQLYDLRIVLEIASVARLCCAQRRPAASSKR